MHPHIRTTEEIYTMIKNKVRARTCPFPRGCGMLLVMVFLQSVLPYIQIALGAFLMVAIILQRTGASLGGAFGSDNFSTGFHTRRGLEKTLFRATIALGILFALSALVNLLIN